MLIVGALGTLLEGQAPRPTPAPAAVSSPERQLAALVDEAAAVKVPTRSAEEYARAAQVYSGIEDRLKQVDRSKLGLDDQVDYDLLDAHVRTRRYEIESVRLYQVDPTSYIVLDQTNNLFRRPGALPDAAVREAIRELRALPAIVANARKNLTAPAPEWTQNALYQAYYAKQMLEQDVPGTPVDDPQLKQTLLVVADEASGAVKSYEQWIERELLPRSTRSAAWKPDQIEFYQSVHEQLPEFGVDAMLAVATEEERVLTQEMTGLAKQIHPSGDLKKVWELMKEEAPPWEGVVPMARRYVEMETAWLRGPGAKVVTIPDYIDYGAALSPPMVRRALSFGGAGFGSGPTIAGRQSGYYTLTPLEDRLTPEEKASRIKSYNPYWTHVISYHEWLGHTVQRAAAAANVTRPMRKLFQSRYFSQAWSFYLEKLFEDEGYYDTLPYMDKLKTLMARRQMRMWRVQRILTKCRMAKGEMTFAQAVDAYVQKIGMEPTNAFIEVQRDSQSPSPPGAEIIGERIVLRLRDEYTRRLGEHYTLKRFDDNLLTYGDLPFRQIRRLMFRD